MKKFLGVYIGTEAGLERAQWSKLDEEKRKARQAAGFAAWVEWGRVHAASIVDQGRRSGRQSARRRKESATSRTSWSAT